MSDTDSERDESEAAKPEPTEPEAAKPGATGAGVESGPTSASRRSPALIATIIAIPVMVVVGFIVFAAAKTTSSPGPLPLQSAAAPQQNDPDCARLIAALPETFAGFGERTIDDGLVSWAKGDDVSGPVQLRCGVPRPTDLAPTSALQTVDPVQWFLRAPKDDEKGALWFAVDHRPYIALWLPNNSGNGAISDVSTIIEKILPLAPIDLGS